MTIMIMSVVLRTQKTFLVTGRYCVESLSASICTTVAVTVTAALFVFLTLNYSNYLNQNTFSYAPMYGEILYKPIYTDSTFFRFSRQH